MSVIGKMSVQSDQVFSDGQKVTLGVVCENQFMAHYHPENENVVFTRYSPSGQGTLQLVKPVEFPKGKGSYTHYQTGKEVEFEKPCELYLIYLKQMEIPNIDNTAFFAKLKVSSVTLYGGDMKQVELCNDYASGPYLLGDNESRMINLKLGIDNPKAADQFVPGETGWWVLAYYADKMTQDEALSLAHAS